MSEDLLLQFMHKPTKEQKMIVLILSDRCGMVGVGLGELRMGGNELSMKKEYF
jgi:hypothetical protein